jgi:hypothetical protein
MTNEELIEELEEMVEFAIDANTRSQRNDTAVGLAILYILREQRRQEHQIRRQEHQIKFILRELGHPDTLHVRLTTGDSPLDTTQQATASVIESSSVTGNSFPVVPANLQFSIDNTAVATVSPNGDGTALVSPVAVGSAILTVTDTSNGLVGTVGVTVTAPTGGGGTPDTLTVTLSQPFPAGTSLNGGTVAQNAAKSKTGAKLV